MQGGFAGSAPPAGRKAHVLRRFALATSVAALSLAASASPAAASVKIGQLAPGVAGAGCGSMLDILQPTVTSGNSYVVPSTVAQGTVTSWSHNAAPAAGQMLTMKVFRKIADPFTYSVVGHDGPRPLTGGVINTFTSSLAVKPGDVLGVNTANAAAVMNACAFSVIGETGLIGGMGDVADGASATFAMAPNTRVNVSAVVEPSNSFSFDKKIKLNKRKGTATVKVNVPNPGKLTASGKGIRASSGGGAVISKQVAAPGKVKLKIRAKGKKLKKLKRKGVIKVTPAIIYKPTGGDARTRTLKLKLKKNRRRR